MAVNESIVLCDSTEEYGFVAAHHAAGGGFLPVIESPPPWRTEGWNGGDATRPRRSAEAIPGAREPWGSRWRALTWGARCDELLEAMRSGNGEQVAAHAALRTTIVVGQSDAAVCAALLAGSMGWRLRLADDLLEACLDQLRRPGERVVVAVLRDAAGDDLLFGLLSELQMAIGSAAPFDKLPRFTLLSARNAASLSWVAAKLILARRRVPAGSATLRLFSPESEACLVEELRIGGSAEPGAESELSRGRLRAGELIAAYTAPAELLAVGSHGFDACAHGGSTAVLCGQPSELVSLDGTRPGTLACAREHPCPRGPDPIPLERMRAEILMLGICNGVRLSDSILLEHFNLCLSFLDGPGLGYVSSLFAISGTEAAAVAFTAAMASGWSMEEATVLINCLIVSARIDPPTYIALGDPDHRLPHGRRSCPPLELAPPFEADLTHSHLAEILIADRQTVELAARGQLALEVFGRGGTEGIGWFARLERDGSDEGGSTGQAADRVRIFLFRFPEALGKLRLLPVDSALIAAPATEAIGSLRRWIEVWRLSGVREEARGRFEKLRAAEMEVEGSLARLLAEIRYNTDAALELHRLTRAARGTAARARDAVLDELLPSLARTYWLSHAFTPECLLEESEMTSCAACRGSVVRKRFRHLVHGARRVTDVCARCGIVQDILEGPGIQSLEIDAPLQVRAGETYEISMSMDVADSDEPIVVCPRLSTLGQYEIAPEPERSEWIPGRQEPLRFTFRLPADLRPHRFFIKAFAASIHELAFASRVFFVR